MAKKKAAAAAAVVPKPAPVAVVLPEPSEQTHIRRDASLEDQVVLLNVCPFRCSPTLASESNHLSECLLPSRVPPLCRLYRQPASGTDPAQETWGGR